MAISPLSNTWELSAQLEAIFEREIEKMETGVLLKVSALPMIWGYLRKLRL